MFRGVGRLHGPCLGGGVRRFQYSSILCIGRKIPMPTRYGGYPIYRGGIDSRSHMTLNMVLLYKKRMFSQIKIALHKV